ncbi:MAG: type IV toxin-antitoxin system AbiEi family antitoxin domain-containing protein [Actinomycetota bacterium]
MTIGGDRRCARLAESQRGLFNLAQARAAGISDSQLRRRVESGALVRRLPTVFCIAGTPKTRGQALLAACLWAGENSAVSHRAAARLWGFQGFGNAPIEISMVGSRRPKGLDIVVHRVDNYLVPDIVSVAGIPVTSIPRTLLDLAGMRDLRCEQALDRCLHKKLVSLGQLWLRYEEGWTRGRRGIAIIRESLVHRTPGSAPTQSELEDMAWRLINKRSLPLPIRQHPVVLDGREIHVDFGYPERMLAIEVDGYAWHMDRRSFERDRERDNALGGLGWRVLRFTWAKLRWDPNYVEDTIRRHLAAPSGS